MVSVLMVLSDKENALRLVDVLVVVMLLSD